MPTTNIHAWPPTVLVTAYKKLLLKLHLEDPSYVGSSRLGSISAFEQARLKTELSFQRAFSKVEFALVKSDLRALWQEGAQRAREYSGRYLRSRHASTSGRELSTETSSTASSSQQNAVTEEQLEKLFGKDGALRQSVIYILARTSRAFMQRFNSTVVEGIDIMEEALRRPAGQPLITVCNHVGALDDPLIMSTIIPPAFDEKPESLRWTLCATDRCFKYASLVPFFRAAKVLPVQRGGGMQQAGMQAAEQRLQRGDWVHIFPEGTRTRDGSGRMGVIRKGVGRLVASCATPPLVVPFVHTGMEEVMPRGKTMPSVGKQVRVLVGQPIPVEDLLSAAARLDWSEDQLHKAIAARVSQQLHALKAQLDGAGAVLPEAATAASGEVSGLDLYDESDLSWEQRLPVWEKLTFKMKHRQWVLQQRLASLAAAAEARWEDNVERAAVRLQARFEQVQRSPAVLAAAGMVASLHERMLMGAYLTMADAGFEAGSSGVGSGGAVGEVSSSSSGGRGGGDEQIADSTSIAESIRSGSGSGCAAALSRAAQRGLFLVYERAAVAGLNPSIARTAVGSYMEARTAAMVELVRA